jgi:hypothetical protein
MANAAKFNHLTIYNFMSKTKNEEMDALVMELVEKVRQKQKEVVAASERPQWETSCTIGTNENISTNVNIQTVTDVNKLVDLYALLLAKEEFYTIAAKELGVKATLKWQGYTFEAWKNDFKTRVRIVNLSAKKQELKSLEERLDKLVTPEQRRELELAAIKKEFEKTS